MNIHDIEAYFRLLGLEPGATLDDVKREHRNLLQAFHPDKFEKGSKRQEWANEKLIQLNEAVDAIKAFFKTYPEGCPPEGWSTKKTVHAEPMDGFFDYRDWRRGTGSASTSLTEQVLVDWRKRQSEEQKSLAHSFGREGRSNIVFFGRIALSVLVVLIWMGHGASTQRDNVADKVERTYLKERLRYQLSHNQISPEVAKAEAQRYLKKKREKESDIQVTGYWNIALAALCIYAWFGRRPRQFFKDWIEGSESKKESETC